jgi:hypothetical protein
MQDDEVEAAVRALIPDVVRVYPAHGQYRVEVGRQPGRNWGKRSIRVSLNTGALIFWCECWDCLSSDEPRTAKPGAPEWGYALDFLLTHVQIPWPG